MNKDICSYSGDELTEFLSKNNLKCEHFFYNSSTYVKIKTNKIIGFENFTFKLFRRIKNFKTFI